MPNYREMYFKIFNEITDVIERLQKVQQETEELYISENSIDLWEAEKPE